MSKGTVDRVLHNRGEVSRKSREKVMRVIEELGYKPNLYASVLASRRLQKIVCIIPEYSPGEFWELTARGIRSGQEKSSVFGVKVETVQYDQYDVESFISACRRTLEIGPSGVILAPMFRAETLKFVGELREKGIYYMYIDSRKDTGDIYARLDALFAADQDPEKYIVMFNSRIHLVADYLKHRDIHTCRVVGFDVLEKNMQAMREGYVQMLIAQHSDLQAEAAISAMADRLLIGKPVARRDNYTQMDIINRYNCDYYL